MTSLLEAHGLSRRFGGVLALDSLDLSVAPNEIIGLIGPNGSGKSTTFNCIAGLYSPSAGSIRFEGTEIAGLTADRVCHQGIGRTFQRSNVFGEFSAFENCRLAAQARRPRAWAVYQPAARCRSRVTPFGFER